MVHNHWPVGPEPQLRLTSVCDGIAFVAWVNSYHDHTTEEGQIALNARSSSERWCSNRMVLAARVHQCASAGWKGYSVWKKLADVGARPSGAYAD